MKSDCELLEEFREQADFINNLYGLGDIDHDTALDKGHIYELMKKYAEHQSKVNNGGLDDVSHQRGLLESFRDWHNNTKIADNNIHNGDLDDFLEDYNCG